MPRYRCTLAVEGLPTSDGRGFRLIDWRTEPLSLMAMMHTPDMGGHGGARLVGNIVDLVKDGNGLVRGVVDISDEAVGEQAEFNENVVASIDRGDLRGFSIDAIIDLEAGIEFECAAEDEDGFCVAENIWFGHGIIAGGTICPWGAFEEAQVEGERIAGEIGPREDAEEEESSSSEGADTQAASAGQQPRTPALAAAGGPVRPPADWFADPQLDTLPGFFPGDPQSGLPAAHPLTIDNDGRVYGHLAPWNECHTSDGYGACRTAPHSPTGYAYFLTGAVECEDGSQVPVGQLTMGTGHCNDLGADYAVAAAHYDNTGTAVADVAAGEDAYGIWIAGALRPGLSDEQVRELRAAAPSGDWRPIRGQLELIAALAVNVQGYPVPRVRARVAAGAPTALVAAGASQMAAVRRHTAGCGCGSSSHQLAALEQRLGQVEAVTKPLAGLAGERLRERIAASAQT